MANGIKGVKTHQLLRKYRNIVCCDASFLEMIYESLLFQIEQQLILKSIALI